MYLLIIQLCRIEYKEDVLLALTSCGIEQGSLVETTNLDHELEMDYPFFAGLIRSDAAKSRYALQIMSVVDHKEKVQMFLGLLKEADIDIHSESILRLMFIPLDLYADQAGLWERT